MRETKIPGDPPERLLQKLLDVCYVCLPVPRLHQLCVVCHHEQSYCCLLALVRGLFGDRTHRTLNHSAGQAASLPPCYCVEDISIASHTCLVPRRI